jgi:hypothetical protein
MRNAAIMALVVGLGAIAVPEARGDVPPRPGDQERLFLNLIEASGHACGQVGSFKSATSSDAETYTKAGLDAFTVECTNGKTYLVAIAPRRPGPPQLDPSGKPITSPAPEVKEIEK